MTQSSHASRLYEAVKDMAVAFEIRPGRRLNEVELAGRLGASRTPLREALNRLAAEGFLTFQPGRGFFCRDIRPREIFELYQLRQILETAAIRLACDTAMEREVDDIARFLSETGPGDNGRSSQELVALDEQFHMSLMALTRNEEMVKLLKNLNARIKFFRWIDMDNRRMSTQGEHSAIIEALKLRDGDLAAHRMGAHIDRRLGQITTAIKEGMDLYLDAHDMSGQKK